jgi:DNA-binding XRE family transcriptional regulator
MTSPSTDPEPHVTPREGAHLALRDRFLITRKRLRRSQSQVARDLGVSRKTIMRFEQGLPSKSSTARMIVVWIVRNGRIDVGRCMEPCCNPWLWTAEGR